jgi:NAD(P)-dependent dehydrogenase (short-subunit alcohol dehydrogenase family)
VEEQMLGLENQVALIAGAFTDGAEDVACVLAKQGARVVLAGDREEDVRAVANEIGRMGGEALVFVGNMSDAESASAAVSFAIEQFGGLDVVVIASGASGSHCDDLDVDADEWLQAESRTAYLVTRFALPHLRRASGTLLSLLADAAEVHSSAGQAFQRWVRSFMKGVAVEQAKYGVATGCLTEGDSRDVIEAECLDIIVGDVAAPPEASGTRHALPQTARAA